METRDNIKNNRYREGHHELLLYNLYGHINTYKSNKSIYTPTYSERCKRSKRETPIQCWPGAGPASTTLDQHQTKHIPYVSHPETFRVHIPEY